MRFILMLVLVAFLGSVFAQTNTTLTIGNLIERQAKPGEYVTLGFTVNGTGEYTFNLVAPANWAVLSGSKTLTLEGEERSVAFTVQVAGDARAETVESLVLNATQNDVVKGSAKASIRVLAVPGIALRAPDEIRRAPNDVIDFEMFVTNTGNRRDVFQISAVGSFWPVSFEPPSLSLEAGESKPIKVSLFPQGEFNLGYFYVLRIRGEPSLGVQAASEIQVTVRFENKSSSADTIDSSDLKLILNLKLELNPSLRFPADQEAAFGFSLGVVPTVTGDLSDYVSTSTGFSGTGFGLKFPPLGLTIPSAFNLNLRASIWETTLNLDNSGLNFEGNLNLKDWRISANSAYATRQANQSLSFGVRLTSLMPELRLELFTGIQIGGLSSNQAVSHSEVIGASYKTQLLESLGLSLGATLFGKSNVRTDSYDVGFSISQGLVWNTQDLIVQQGYTGIPLDGQHVFSLVAALRNTVPYSLRGNSTFDLATSDQFKYSWRNSVVATYSTDFGFLISGTAGYEIQNKVNFSSTWSLGTSLGYGFTVPGTLFGNLGAKVEYTGVIDGDAASTDHFELNGSLNFGSLQFSALGSFTRQFGAVSIALNEITTASFSVRYSYSSQTAFVLNYEYRLEVENKLSEIQSLNLAWTQRWSSTISSSLVFSKLVQFNFVNPASTGDQLFLALIFKDVLLENVGIRVGWLWSSPTSIFDANGLSNHEFSVSVGYNLSLPFVTPAPVTAIFGGRQSGEIYGVAFKDNNTNGKPDPDEPVLAGISVSLGRETAISDAQGRYRLRVPVGTYQLNFPSGLNAELDLFGGREETIKLDESRERNLGFVAVSSLEVHLFDDLNRNGVQDSNEIGIPYGGINVAGPITKNVRVDGSGMVIVTGLISGTYTITPDNSQLPDGYQLTGEVGRVTIDAPNPTNAISVSAAFPARELVTTFNNESLALFVNANASTLPPGADLRLEALVQGNVTSVSAKLGDRIVPLVKNAENWQATISLPISTIEGLLTVTVTASDGKQTVDYDVNINIQPGDLFEAEPILAVVGNAAAITVTTLFQIPNGQLELVFPDNSRIQLQSEDGYHWTGTWVASATAGLFDAQLVFGSRVLGVVPVTVRGPTKP
jgi:hypothetical protein